MSFKSIVLNVLAGLLLTIFSLSAAEAKPKRVLHEKATQSSFSNPFDFFASIPAEASIATEPKRAHRARAARNSEARDLETPRQSGVGPRPGAWCGWYMRTRHGGGPDFNRASHWRHYGSAGSPQIGAIVVWPHHVGEIVGQTSSGQWIVLSGNDSHRVRQRPRSIAGALVRI